MSLTVKDIVESCANDTVAIRTLEASVEAQAVGGGNYDFEANKYLLKLYACFPETQNVDKIVAVNVLAMMKLPAKDLLAVHLMIPPALESNAKLQVVNECIKALESGQFKKFWDEKNGPAASGLFTVSGFDDAIRSFIFGNLCDSFRSIKVSKFMTNLNLQTSAEYESFCHRNRSAIASVIFFVLVNYL